MALHWDVTTLRDQETVFVGEGTDKKLDPVIEAMVWAQMALNTGGKITNANHKEVFKRIHIWERVHGSFLSTTEGPRPITLSDVKRCIGLSTNAFGDEGKRYFKEKIMASLFESAERELREQEEAAKTTVGVMEDSGAA